MNAFYKASMGKKIIAIYSSFYKKSSLEKKNSRQTAYCRWVGFVELSSEFCEQKDKINIQDIPIAWK